MDGNEYNWLWRAEDSWNLNDIDGIVIGIVLVIICRWEVMWFGYKCFFDSFGDLLKIICRCEWLCLNAIVDAVLIIQW